MLKVRNTLVAVRLVEKGEQKHGAIFVNGGTDCFTEAEVVSVGPGNIAAQGGQSETADLAVGQRVLVQHKTKMSNGSGLIKYRDEGIPVRHEESDYILFEQNSILAVLSEPDGRTPLFAKSLNASYNMGAKAILPSDNN